MGARHFFYLLLFSNIHPVLKRFCQTGCYSVEISSPSLSFSESLLVTSYQIILDSHCVLTLLQVRSHNGSLPSPHTERYFSAFLGGSATGPTPLKLAPLLNYLHLKPLWISDRILFPVGTFSKAKLGFYIFRGMAVCI